MRPDGRGDGGDVGVLDCGPSDVAEADDTIGKMDECMRNRNNIPLADIRSLERKTCCFQRKNVEKTTPNQHC